MDKLNPIALLSDWEPTPEAVLQVSHWFRNEYIVVTLDVDEKGMLGWFLAQGWDVYSSFNNKTIGGAASVVTSVTYSLRRRKLQSERVLQDMVTEFTSAYNEGREVNDQRYDELVTLYALTLDKTEDELNSISSDDDTYEDLVNTLVDGLDTNCDELDTVTRAVISALKAGHTAYTAIVNAMATATDNDQDAYESLIIGLIATISGAHTAYDSSIRTITDAIGIKHSSYEGIVNGLVGVMEADYDTFADVASIIITSMEDDFSTFATEMDTVLDGYGESLREQINTRFDNELAKQKQNLVTRGMYNSTIWENIESGIERERSLALTDLEDKIAQQQVGIKSSVYSEQAQMRTRVLGARDQLFSRLQAIRLQDMGAQDRIQQAYSSSRNQILQTLGDLQKQLRTVYAERNKDYTQIYDSQSQMRKIVQDARDRLQSHSDEVNKVELDAHQRLQEANARITDQIIKANERLRLLLKDSRTSGVTIRNQAMMGMMQFMESRNDDYPGIGELANIAAGLGYAEGGSVTPPT